MKKLTIGATGLAAAMLIGTAAMYRGRTEAATPVYRTAAVTRGSVTSTVSSTGVLNAVRTVQVGTQVSGQIRKIYVDFNDHVKQGQLLATIDPKLQQQAVEDAEAQLERARAQLALAEDEYTRNKQLFDAKVLSASEYATTQSNFSVQQAAVKSAQIALERAKQNLSYTSIYAPIDGVIVSRDVNDGQTVASSLSAPQLFVIANDLSEMEILASVDEGDIGAIKDGLPVSFTVQAYPNQTFRGSVRQVRLQSTTVENVVTYTAVISVKNLDGRLRPGMTATVKFETATENNAFLVPAAALRMTPTEEMKAQAGIVDSAPRMGGGRGNLAARRDTGALRQRIATGGARPALLWTVDSTGKVGAIHVRAGVSDGQKTAVQGSDLREGMSVIIGLSAEQAAQQAEAAASNPLMPQRGRGGRGF
jgi:HlyD family secretion protein